MFNTSFTNYGQLTLFNDPLLNSLDPKNRYILLKDAINWPSLVSDITFYFKETGRKSLPLRTMIGLTIVKYIDDLSDERVIQLYIENPYVQAFCGQVEFQKNPPCSNAMLSVFRNKIGKDGHKRIMQESIKINGECAYEESVIVDTTAQPKNVTYPTDVELIVKVIENCQTLARELGISLKNTYKIEVHLLLSKVRFEKSNKKRKEVRKAKKRLTTIAGILVRELKRKIERETFTSYEESFLIYEKVIAQVSDKRNTSQELQEEIDKLEVSLEKTIKLSEANGVNVKESEIAKIENIRNKYKNAKGRGKQNSLKKSIDDLKRIIKTLLKRLTKCLDKGKLLTIECDIAHINDSLVCTKKDTKIYSIHEPGVACIAKGKVGVKYEYGSKASIVVTKESGVIVGAVNFQGNPYDGNTMEESIKDVVDNIGQRPKDVYADRGYKGAQEKNKEIAVHLPETPSEDATEEEKENARKNFGRRSSIEPIIGHLKSDCRLKKTYLKGKRGDQINLYMSCAAFNFKKWLRTKENERERKKVA